MFSVVIPLYNKQNEIRKTLESVLSQTFQNFEIVIVNDGSTDGSLEVVESMDDPRIRLVNKENGGVSSARNRGIQEAKFKWIAFLDADDLWHEAKLQEVSNVIIQQPDVEWVFSGYKAIKGATTYEHCYPHNGKFEDVLEALVGGLSIQTSTVVVRKQYFQQDEKLYFPLGINNSEDREIWYRLCFRFPSPYYLRQDLTYYIIDETGGSLNTSRTPNFSFLGLEERIKDYFKYLSNERRERFLSFLFRFNSRACWGIWVKIGWSSNFESFVDQSDKNIMRAFSKFPRICRRMVYNIGKATRLFGKGL